MTAYMNKEEYWLIRDKSETAWNQSIDEIRAGEDFKKLSSELELLNEQRKEGMKQYYAIYGIHPQDKHIVDFYNQSRGKYIDCMWRCDYFGGKPCEDQENRYPVPGKPVKFYLERGIREPFTFNIRFGTAQCLLCSQRDTTLPIGFFCGNCMSDNIDKIRINGVFNVEFIKKLLINNLKCQLNTFKAQLENCKGVDKIIKVECDTGFYSNNNFDWVTVRIVLISCEEIDPIPEVD